jgi:two-component system, OmpR family, sensor kinase
MRDLPRRVLPRRVLPRRWGQAQLRTRILAGVLLVTLGVLAAFDVAAVTALRGYLIGQADSQLRNVLDHRQLLNQALLPVGTKPPKPATRSSLRDLEPLFSLGRILNQDYAAVISHRGVSSLPLIEGNADLRPRLPADLATLAADHRAQTVASVDGEPQLRLAAARVRNGILVVTTSLNGVDQTIGQLRLIVIAGSAAAGLLVGLVVTWLVRRGLRPIEVMAAQAGRISAGDLFDRVAIPDTGTEVGRLGAALNGMLARIETFVAEREASQELTRRFFADASHELRNPLASLRANAELYQQGALPSRPDVDQAMDRITWEARRMGSLVDDMLQLARLDQHPARHSEPVDLTALADGCLRRAQIADGARTWQADIAAGLVVIGDEELLRRAIDNLLANVTAHTPAATTATLTATRTGDAVVVEVSDNGPGVPRAQLSRIFERFYRTPVRSPGSGLGLASAAAAAAAHDGAAQAALNDPDGLRVTLSFPVSPSGRRCRAEDLTGN